MVTYHTGYFSFTNNWDQPITNVTVAHYRKSDPESREEIIFPYLCVGETIEKCKKFVFEHGDGSLYDYWDVVFYVNGRRHYNNDFYCNVTPEDDGNVELSVNYSNEKFHVSFSSSGSCNKSILT